MIFRLLPLTLAALAVLPVSAKKSSERVHIDPPHWWVGMNSSQLQLQVHAPDIRDALLSYDYPTGGVKVDSVVRLDGSPNWQYIYLTISPEAKPGTLLLTWKDGKKTYRADYQLKERNAMKGAQGFDASDVLYLVMPDRFADGNPANNLDPTMRNPAGANRQNPNLRHGGDIQGMLDHIDYIDSLGITAVWVNPVLENDIRHGSYHGYATTDYYRIDPRFGTNEEYAVFIDSLHNRGIKTVMDMIFNHCGSDHPWRLDPPASDWFNFQDNYQQTNYRLQTVSDPYASDYDRTMTIDGWFVRGMPDLNQRNPHLMKYLSQNSIWWIEESGIDGIRMDTYAYVPQKQMGEWIDDINREYPDFAVVGECWLPETTGIAYWQKHSPFTGVNGDTNLPVIMDFPLMIKSRDLAPFREQTEGAGGLNTIYDHLALDYAFADPMKVLRFLDNHDTERVITEDIDDLAQWKQAITLLLTVPGIPQLYYGTELLMSGTRAGGDGNIRKDVPGGFPGDSINAFSRAGRTPLQNEAFDFIAGINQWRKHSAAIASGSMKHFIPNEGVYVYERKAGDDAVLVIMNGRDTAATANLARYAEVMPGGAEWVDILTGQPFSITASETAREFAPRETHILQKIK